MVVDYKFYQMNQHIKEYASLHLLGTCEYNRTFTKPHTIIIILINCLFCISDRSN